MVAFMLHHAGMKAGRLALDRLPLRRHAAVADRGMAGDPARQTGYGKAALPAADHRLAGLPQRSDLWIDQGGRRHRLRPLTCRPRRRHMEDHDPPGDMDLRGGKAGPADIRQGLPHIGHQPADLRRRGIGEGVGGTAQHRMAHAGDLEDRHGSNMAFPGRAEKAPPPLDSTSSFRMLRSLFTTARRCDT